MAKKEKMNLFDRIYKGNPNKADFSEKDLPETRLQLFVQVLKQNIWKMIGANGLYAIFLVPLIIFSLFYFSSMLTVGGLGGGAIFADPFTNTLISNNMQGMTLLNMLPFYLIVATVLLLISGPAKAGMFYVIRNWSWGEHVFLGSDFKDAMKKNWKQGLFFEFATGFVLLCAVTSYIHYDGLAATEPVWHLVKYFVLAVATMYMLMSMYFYPLLVTYELKIWQILKNSFLMTAMTLPMTVLFSLIPAAVIVISFFLGNIMLGMGIMVTIGFAFTALAQFSFCNSVFDKYMNPRIEGAPMRRGLKPLKTKKGMGKKI